MICEKLLANLEWDWDFYQVIPPSMETERIPNHRLLMRRNKKTGRYEVRRHFYTRRIIKLKEAIVETGEDLQAEEVAFEGDFEDAVKFANSEMVRYGMMETFDVCEHRPPNINRFCPDAAGMFPDQLQGVTWRMRKFRRRPWYRLIRCLLWPLTARPTHCSLLARSPLPRRENPERGTSESR